MDEDRKPVAAIALGGVSQQPARKDVPRQSPGLMQVIQPEENAIHDPICFAKQAIHFWQEQSVEQEFFTEERIENGENYLKSEQVPYADPARPQLRGEQGRPTVAGRFCQEGEESDPESVEEWPRRKFQEDQQQKERDQHPPQTVILLSALQ